jgi:pimeloyl-ACP methyl ester carboxylesterase
LRRKIRYHPGNPGLDEIFSDDGLKRLLSGYRTACFVLARAGLQERFYQDLVQNIDTIDATTRDHVAFIVFHGNRSSYIRDHGGPRLYSYNVKGLSVSTEPERRHQGTSEGDIGFSGDFRERIKAEPTQAPFSAIGRATDYAATLLMERFDVRETSLPCLLFLDQSSISRPQIVCLSPSTPMQSLYQNVLAPLSDELRLVDGLRKQRAHIDSYIRWYEYSKTIVQEFPEKKSKLEQQLSDIRSEIDQIRQTHPMPSLDRLLIERTELEAIRRKYKELNTLEERINLALTGPDASIIIEMNQRLDDLTKARSEIQALPHSDENTKQLHQISSSIGRLRSKLGSLATRPAAEAANRLSLIENEIQKAKKSDPTTDKRWKEEQINSELRHIQHNYNDAQKRIADHSVEYLSNERLKVTETENLLRRHGFNGSILQADRISALDVVEVLSKTGIIGWRSSQRKGRETRPTPLSAAPAKGLLLFIHGLGGARSATWGDFPSYLMSFPSIADNYVVDYYSFPTQIVRLPFSARAPKIQVLADGLRTQIKYANHERVTLLCHSLGGLVAKQYLIEEIDSRRELSVDGVLFFGVPNNGAELAAIGNLISWRQHQLKQLRKDADIIELSNRAWHRLDVHNKIRLKYIVGSQDRVVDRLSAQEYWGNPDVETVIGCGHIDIVKPKSADDLVVRMVRDFLLT